MDGLPPSRASPFAEHNACGPNAIPRAVHMSTQGCRRYKKNAAPPMRSRRVRLHEFEAAVLATVRSRALFRPDARVLAALSGGPDSTALVAALAALRDAGQLGAVVACHVDHQLREGSAADGDFCETLCRHLSIPLQRVAVDVPRGANVQAAARRARYVALARAARCAGAEHVATGHHRGDQAETVLHRLLRGAGARGLGGIPARRGAVIRPLIDRSRREVLSYLADRGLSWREDPTNASARYLRNRIRAELLPLLDALAPGIEGRLARMAELLRADDRALERLAARVVPSGTPRVGIAELLALPLAARRRAVRRLWRAASGSRRDLGATHVEAIVRLLRASGARRVALPRGIQARVEGEDVELGPPPTGAPALPSIRVEGPGTYAVPALAAAVEIAWRSGQPPPWPLELRGRRPGDRFRPERGRGEKKLKAWLIDRKIPRARRDALVVLADAQGHVLSMPQLGVRAEGAAALEVRWAAGGQGDG